MLAVVQLPKRPTERRASRQTQSSPFLTRVGLRTSLSPSQRAFPQPAQLHSTTRLPSHQPNPASTHNKKVGAKPKCCERWRCMSRESKGPHPAQRQRRPALKESLWTAPYRCRPGPDQVLAVLLAVERTNQVMDHQSIDSIGYGYVCTRTGIDLLVRFRSPRR